MRGYFSRIGMKEREENLKMTEKEEEHCMEVGILIPHLYKTFWGC